MWVCLQSVLANDEKENVELLVVKYSHVVFTVFFSVIVFLFLLYCCQLALVLWSWVCGRFPRRGVLKLWRKRGVFI